MAAWPAAKKTMLHDGCSSAAATPATASTDTAAVLYRVFLILSW